MGAYIQVATWDPRVNRNEGGGSHYGVDITSGGICNQTEIRAVANGRIVAVVNDWLENNQDNRGTLCGDNSHEGLTGFGNYVIVQHDSVPGRDGYGGRSYSIYAHLATVEEDIIVDRFVLRGSKLGTFGSTGGSSGPHLHFQIDKDITDYPHPYYPRYRDPSIPLCATPDARTNYSCITDTVANQASVLEHTFNPLQFVQKHLVMTNFNGQGACTQYFSGDLGPKPINISQCTGFTFEKEIDHEWLKGGPSGYPSDNFSARWIGEIMIPYGKSKNWIFYISDDDIAKVWIDDQLILDDTVPNNEGEPNTWVRLVQNLHAGVHLVQVEYKEVTSSLPNVDNATMQLAWQPSGVIHIPLMVKPLPPTITPTHTPTRTPTRTPTGVPTRTPTRTPTPNPAFSVCEPNDFYLSEDLTNYRGSLCRVERSQKQYFLYHENESPDVDVYNVSVAAGCYRKITLVLTNTPEQYDEFRYRFEVYDEYGHWKQNGLESSPGKWTSSNLFVAKDETLNYFMRVYSEEGYSSTNTYTIYFEESQCLQEPLSNPYPAP